MKTKLLSPRFKLIGSPTLSHDDVYVCKQIKNNHTHNSQQVMWMDWKANLNASEANISEAFRFFLSLLLRGTRGIFIY